MDRVWQVRKRRVQDEVWVWGLRTWEEEPFTERRKTKGEQGGDAGIGWRALRNQGFHVGCFCLRCLFETPVETTSGQDIQGRRREEA